VSFRVRHGVHTYNQSSAEEVEVKDFDFEAILDYIRRHCLKKKMYKCLFI
jgi:hypothetical protein